MEKMHIERNLTGIHHGLTQQWKDLFCTQLTKHFMQHKEEASVEKRIKKLSMRLKTMFDSVKYVEQIECSICSNDVMF